VKRSSEVFWLSSIDPICYRFLWLASLALTDYRSPITYHF